MGTDDITNGSSQDIYLDSTHYENGHPKVSASTHKMPLTLFYPCLALFLATGALAQTWYVDTRPFACDILLNFHF